MHTFKQIVYDRFEGVQFVFKKVMAISSTVTLKSVFVRYLSIVFLSDFVIFLISSTLLLSMHFYCIKNMMKQSRKSFGSILEKTLLKVSWLGIPLLSSINEFGYLFLTFSICTRLTKSLQPHSFPMTARIRMLRNSCLIHLLSLHIRNSNTFPNFRKRRSTVPSAQLESSWLLCNCRGSS